MPVYTDEKALYSRIRYPWQTPRRSSGEEEISRLRDEQCFNIGEQPKPVRDTYRHAVETVVEEGEPLAFYFLLCTGM